MSIFKQQKYRRKGTDTIVVQIENSGYDVYKCLIINGPGKGCIREFYMCEFEPYNGEINVKFE